MKAETIEKIFNFLKEKEGKELPGSWFASIRKLNLIKELENHPDNIRYIHEGDLDLSYSIITKLPNDLHVDGGLYLDHCKQITKLPDKLHVGGAFDISYSNVTKLPNNLYVGDHLWLVHTNISEIPNNLCVDGDLYAYNTPLADKYTNVKLRKMIKSKGGTLIGKISR